MDTTTKEVKIGDKFTADTLRGQGREWPEMQQLVNVLQRHRIALCWGPHRWTKWGTNVLIFLVQGYLHKGAVALHVNASDLFDIYLLNHQRNVKHIKKDVYLEDLIETIDSLVETKQG